jgi:hypothetical protein
MWVENILRRILSGLGQLALVCVVSIALALAIALTICIFVAATGYFGLPYQILSIIFITLVVAFILGKNPI